MKVDKEQLEDLLEQFDLVIYAADASKSFTVGKFKVFENKGSWTVSAPGVNKEFTTRMAALSWAKFVAEGKEECAQTVERLSEEFDGATAHLKQLVKTSVSQPAVLGKIDPALDKRKQKVNNLADYILKNS